jgi:hypothetical protein
VQVRLRPQLVFLLGDEPARSIVAVDVARRSVGRGQIAGAAAAGLIDHVDGVALAHEVLRPAFAPVRRAGEIGARHGAAVHHHDRITVSLLRRDAHLNIHTVRHEGVPVDRRPPAADVEMAVAGEHQRAVVGGLRDAAQCERDDRHGCRDAEARL